jgi:hypothetical protein
VVHRIDDVSDGTADEGLRRLPKAGAERSRRARDLTARLNLDHEVGRGEREGYKTLVVVNAAKIDAIG